MQDPRSSRGLRAWGGGAISEIIGRGYSADREVEEETTDGKTQFLNKPFNSQTLIRRVADILIAS